MLLYGVTVQDPVVLSSNDVRIDNRFAVLAAGTRYLIIGGNSTLFVKGGAAGGSITVTPTRATAGDPRYQGQHAVGNLVVDVAENEVKRVPVQAGLYLDERGLLTCVVAGNLSTFVLRREVEGQ